MYVCVCFKEKEKLQHIGNNNHFKVVIKNLARLISKIIQNKTIWVLNKRRLVYERVISCPKRHLHWDMQ